MHIFYSEETEVRLCAFASMLQLEIEKYERCRARNGRWEEIAVYKAAFLVLVIMFLICIWGNMGRVIMNAVIRCLFCLICVYLCNGLIQYFGGRNYGVCFDTFGDKWCGRTLYFTVIFYNSWIKIWENCTDF